MPPIPLPSRTFWRRLKRRAYVPVPVVNAIVLLSCLVLLLVMQAVAAPNVTEVSIPAAPDVALAQR